MGKAQPGKASQGVNTSAGGKAGVSKASPNCKKAKTDSKKFIDDLFSKPVKPSAPDSEKIDSSRTKQSEPAKPGKKVKGPVGGRDDLFGLQESGRKKTEEGWNIYSEEELMMNKRGGSTELCPFDCECCY